VTDGKLKVVVAGLGGDVTVVGDGRRLVWTEHRDATAPRRAELQPTPDAWAAFWRTLDGLDVWEWQRNYRGGSSQTACAAALESGRRRVEVRAKGTEPPDWDEFCRAVSELAGRPFSPFFEAIVETSLGQNRCRIVWWDWKDHVPFDELLRARDDGLTWMRVVPDTHCDQHGLVCSTEPTSLEDAEEAWVVGWEDGYDPEEDVPEPRIPSD
jgi:hypothetical protein